MTEDYKGAETTEEATSIDMDAIRAKTKLNLNNIQEVASSISGALSSQKIEDLTKAIDPEALRATITDQAKLITQAFSMIGSGGAGTTAVQDTLNSALSSVMSAMTCNLDGLQSSFAKIDKLTSQINNIQDAIQTGDIEEIKKTVV